VINGARTYKAEKVATLRTTLSHKQLDHGVLVPGCLKIALQSLIGSDKQNPLCANETLIEVSITKTDILHFRDFLASNLQYLSELI
jgi:hypothetical protein